MKPLIEQQKPIDKLIAPRCRVRTWVLHKADQIVPLAWANYGACWPLIAGYEPESGYVWDEV